MKKILLRAGKSPFDSVSAESTLAKNTIGNNNGNYLFSHSAHRMLSSKGSTVDAHGLAFHPREADFINKNYDALVVPLANAFRPSFIKRLDNLTKLIEKLTIPVTILSVGLQSDLHTPKSENELLDKYVRRFVDAVLEHSPTLGVRGEITAKYLSELGYADIEVIGCPSMFMNGDRINITKTKKRISSNSRVSFTVTPQNKAFRKTITHNLNKFKNLTYIPQDIETLEFMLWGGDGSFGFKSNDTMPFHPKNKIFTQNKARFFVDAPTWINYLKTRDFMFGDRIHGSVAALLAGTPAFLVAHDTRTLELAQYHGIPHTLLKNKNEYVDASDLYSQLDFSELNNGHSDRFKKFEKYLAKNNLKHQLNDLESLKEYDAKLDRIEFPKPVLSLTANQDEYAHRLEWLYKKLKHVDSKVK